MVIHLYITLSSALLRTELGEKTYQEQILQRRVDIVLDKRTSSPSQRTPVEEVS